MVVERQHGRAVEAVATEDRVAGAEEHLDAASVGHWERLVGASRLVDQPQELGRGLGEAVGESLDRDGVARAWQVDADAAA